MEFSINFHTVKSGWSIIYIKGSKVVISKKCSLNIVFVLANSVDPDEMLHFCTMVHLRVIIASCIKIDKPLVIKPFAYLIMLCIDAQKNIPIILTKSCRFPAKI